MAALFEKCPLRLFKKTPARLAGKNLSNSIKKIIPPVFKRTPFRLPGKKQKPSRQKNYIRK